MSILSTREWAALIWGLLFLVYIICHKEIRESFWKVIVIFFWQEVKNIMGNNTVICSCHHNDILSFNYLGKCLYQGYYHMVSFFRTSLLYECCFK